MIFKGSPDPSSPHPANADPKNIEKWSDGFNPKKTHGDRQEIKFHLGVSFSPRNKFQVELWMGPYTYHWFFCAHQTRHPLNSATAGHFSHGE